MPRKRGECRHCHSVGPMYARGLCHDCYYNLSIRNRYDGPRTNVRHEWTARERQQLKEMRLLTPPVPSHICAKRMGMTISQIENAIKRYNLQVYERDPDKKRSALLKNYDGKRSDATIASIIGCADSHVGRMRRALCLPRSNCTNSRRVTLMRCMACSATSHSSRSKKDGWVSRYIPGWNCRAKEIYCPKCFAKYGWPELELKAECLA